MTFAMTSAAMEMNVTSWIILGILVFAGLITALSFVLIRVLRQEIRCQQDQFLQLAGQQYTAEQNRAVTELETRKQAVEDTVRSLNDELEKYQKLLREFESDRAVKYGQLENELKNASQATLKLQDTTNRLNNMLGNVKMRGQWGERMAEDIIRYAGLLEGINYIKQKKMDQAATKPDYTFLLPDQHKINMDVKFPLDNYTLMVNETDAVRRETYQKEFFKNVRDRVKEIQNRDYINPAEDTLDFVMLFIPNEQVFGFIQDQMPDLMDTALAQKVVLCSPFTLYAMLSVVRQAHEHFRYEKDIRKIIVLIEQFANLYERFKTRFEDVGKTLERLDGQFFDLKNKSFHQLDTKIRHIEDYKKGRRPLLEGGDIPGDIDADDETRPEVPV